MLGIRRVVGFCRNWEIIFDLCLLGTGYLPSTKYATFPHVTSARPASLQLHSLHPLPRDTAHMNVLFSVI